MEAATSFATFFPCVLEVTCAAACIFMFRQNAVCHDGTPATKMDAFSDSTRSLPVYVSFGLLSACQSIALRL